MLLVRAEADVCVVVLALTLLLLLLLVALVSLLGADKGRAAGGKM